MDYLFEHLMDEIKKNTIKRKIDLDKFLQKYTKPLEPSFIQTKAAEQANIEKVIPIYYYCYFDYFYFLNRICRNGSSLLKKKLSYKYRKDTIKLTNF